MSRIDELIEQMRALEDEMQVEFEKKRDDYQAVLAEKRIHFGEEVAALQSRSKRGLFRYVTGASIVTTLTAPIIYVGLVPMALLDLFLFIYQALCFPIYHIAKVKRPEYIVFDRGDLPFLNAAEKMNCLYCGYANGLASYFREIGARTEQYWCPMKHARKIIASHDRYHGFFEYGDAESYRLGLERLRAALAEEGDEREQLA